MESKCQSALSVVEQSMLGIRTLTCHRQLVREHLREIEPEAVKRRARRRFKRKRFWAAGVMDIWTFDQHDKWKRFGLWLHLGLDPFAGRLVWLKIWWTNRNPRLITSYYLEAAREAGGIFLPLSQNILLNWCQVFLWSRKVTWAQRTMALQTATPSSAIGLIRRWPTQFNIAGSVKR